MIYPNAVLEVENEVLRSRIENYRKLARQALILLNISTREVSIDKVIELLRDIEQN